MRRAFFKGFGGVGVSADDPEVQLEKPERLLELRESVRLGIFTWVTRGLQRRHKTTFLVMMVFQLLDGGIIGNGTGFSPELCDFLLQLPRDETKSNVPEELQEWLPLSAYQAVCALNDTPSGEFATLLTDMMEAPNRFREWVDCNDSNYM